MVTDLKILNGPSVRDVELSFSEKKKVSFILDRLSLPVCVVITSMSNDVMKTRHMFDICCEANKRHSVFMYNGESFLLEGIVQSGRKGNRGDKKDSYTKCYMVYSPVKRKGVARFIEVEEEKDTRGEDLLRLAWGGAIFGDLDWAPPKEA